MTDKQKVAKVSLDRREELQGFKVLWLFPFFVSYISMPTQIRICELRDILFEIKGDDKATINDFYNAKLMKKSKPVIFKLITTGLINNKWYNYLLYPFVYMKVKSCNNRDLHGIYGKLLELSDASFFLGFYQHMVTQDHTILKED